MAPGSRAEAAAAGLPNVRFWNGSFAAFAALIAESDLYVGYDSAGQHAAAALPQQDGSCALGADLFALSKRLRRARRRR